MRFGTSSLITVVCLMVGTTFAGCSDDAKTPGSGGAGGETASSTTSGPGTSTSSSSSTTGGGGSGAADGSGGDDTGGDGTGGTNGGSLCEQACARTAEECGVDLCEDLAIDCSAPQSECIAQCVLDAPSCDALRGNGLAFGLCALQCVEDTGAGGGGDSTSCGLCSFQSGCLNSLNCRDDLACVRWAACVGDCFSRNAGPECFRACDEAASKAGEALEARYRAVYACACVNCEDACAASADPCSVGLD